MTAIEIELSCGLKIAIEEDYLWKYNLIRELGDIKFTGKLMSAQSETTFTSLVVTPLSAFSKNNLQYSQDNVYLSNQLLFDKKYKTALQVSPDGCIILESSAPCYEWFFWALQLALLHNNVSFVHGACVEKDGKAILIASRGGVGKTIIVEYFVRKLGWRFLGDDLVIVDGNGKCYAFPKPMVLYPYHKPIFPDVFAKGQGPFAPVWLNPILNHFIPFVKSLLRSCSDRLLEFARRHNPQSVKINPSEIFGPVFITKEAKLEQIIWLDRDAKYSELYMELDGGTLPSQIFAGTLLEFDPHCIRSSLIAMRHGIIRAESVFSRWLDLLAQIVSVVPKKVKLTLPTDLSVEKIGPTVAECILKGL